MTKVPIRFGEVLRVGEAEAWGYHPSVLGSLRKTRTKFSLRVQ